MDSGSGATIPTNPERLGVDDRQLRLASSRSKSVAISLIPEGSALQGSQNYVSCGMSPSPES
jgi:hypothetical protein